MFNKEAAMKKSDEVKEKIIEATIGLITESNGDVADINTRAIADKAKVGVGLINYHFQTKDNLIEICVQQIIDKVVSSFKPKGVENLAGINSLTDAAIRVFDFLFGNPAVSRISILGDLSRYSLHNNSDNTKKGFMLAMGEDMNNEEKNLLAFTLTSAMQTAFLSNHVSKEIIGYDFSKKADRDIFITDLVYMLYGKTNKM
jgi:AcrR family transcriptional regulator